MGKFINAVGMQYGELTVISRESNRNGRVVWLCQCSCGNQKSVMTKYLQNGNVKSCGCLLRRPEGEAEFHALHLLFIHSAMKRGYEWKLTEDDVKRITSSNCFYCGQPPAQIKQRAHCHGVYLYNGIDRVDNSLGYTRDNVVSCCGVCNRAKGTMTQIEFALWINRIHSHWISN